MNRVLRNRCRNKTRGDQSTLIWFGQIEEERLTKRTCRSGVDEVRRRGEMWLGRFLRGGI